LLPRGLCPGRPAHPDADDHDLPQQHRVAVRAGHQGRRRAGRLPAPVARVPQALRAQEGCGMSDDLSSISAGSPAPRRGGLLEYGRSASLFARIRPHVPILATILCFVALYVAASIRYNNFLSYNVFVNVLVRGNVVLGLAAIGMTFVILSGGIDLS